MPFDGNDPTSAVRLIDAVLDVLGPEGERWIKKRLSNARGHHCILGALAYSRRKLRTPRGDHAADYIRQAIRELPGNPLWLTSVTCFNDYPDRRFSEVRDVLHRARALAAGSEGDPLSRREEQVTAKSRNTVVNALPRRQQRQRAALAELVRLLAFCDQHGLDFNQLANEAQEIHRELKADESVPAFLRRLTS